MKYDDFVGQVQHRAQLGTMGQAVGAIRATLETLANRLNLESADNLAAQLPREIGYYLVNAPRCYSERGERFDLDEFFDRVSLIEPADFPVAVYHARVVMEVLGEAVSRGEMRKLLDQLPEDYDRLFLAGSDGDMRPRRRGNRAGRRVTNRSGRGEPGSRARDEFREVWPHEYEHREKRSGSYRPDRAPRRTN